MTAFRDRTFERYGKLIATTECGSAVSGHKLWFCICDCGIYTVILGVNLEQGTTKSCGCLKVNPPAALYINAQHLCYKCHKRPICPSKEKRCPNSALCSMCAGIQRKMSRMQRWDKGERPHCINHPLTIVNRAAWISGNRKCSRCKIKSMSPEAYSKKIHRQYKKQLLDPDYKQYKKYYDAARRKTIKLRNYGN